MTAIRDYFKAHSVAEALTLAEQCEKPARFLAGGTDLLLKLPGGSGPAVTLVDISDVAELAQIEWSEAGLRIGAAVKLADLERAGLEARGYGPLAQGAAEVGSRQIRHLATLGGNVCNASPSADTAAPLLALEAQAELVSARGERTVPLAQFWLGPGRTVLQAGELLAALRLPPPAPGSRGVYLKHKVRGALDLAIVGVGVVLARANGSLDAKIALAAVAPTPIRAEAAEGFLREHPQLGGEVVRQAARLAEAAAAPIGDVRGSAAYRREMVRRLTERALGQAGAAAGNGSHG